MFRYLLVASAFIACACGAPLSTDALAIGRSDSNIDPNGSYSYSYDTSNGIAANEQGVGGDSVNGQFSYTSPDGELVQISYAADENGFNAQGSHVPTPPPTPEAILKSLDYISTHPQYQEQPQVKFQPTSNNQRSYSVFRKN